MDITDPRTTARTLSRHSARPTPRRCTVSLAADRIVIYQRNIERICRTRGGMMTQIRKRSCTEVGHHFGMTEEQLDELGYG